MSLPARVVGVAPRRVARVRRSGVGQTVVDTANNTAGAFGVNLQEQGQSLANSLVAQLPAPVLSAVTSAQSYISQGTPAINLAEALASGKSVSALEVVGAVGATVGLVNPIAGAAIVAMGTIAVEFQNLLQSIFQAVGLYEPPLPTYVFNGLLRAQDTVPYAPFAMNSSGGQMFYDPVWIALPDWLSMQKFMWHGDKNHMAPVTGGFPGSGTNDGTAGVHTMKESYLAGFLNIALAAQMKPIDQWAWLYSWVPGGGGGGNWVKGVPTPAKPSALDPTQPHNIEGQSIFPSSVFHQNAPGSFEEYFNKLLILNLTYWANGQPFMPVRTLLYGAATAWNSMHDGPYSGATPCVAGSSNSICYLPLDGGDQNDPRVQASKSGQAQMTVGGSFGGADIGGFGTTIEWILGPAGAFADPSTTLQKSPPLGINTGPFRSSIQSALDTPQKVVAVSAGVAAAGVTAATLYSFASGQTLGALVSEGLSALRAFFLE